MRDLFNIFNKIKFFYQNTSNDKDFEKEIKDYDMWGPFLFFLFFASAISFSSANSLETTFSTIIVFIIFGVSVIVMNFKLMKIQMNFFAGYATIGYLMFPLTGASIFNAIFHFLPFFLKFPVTLLALFASLKISWNLCLKISGQQNVFLTFYPISLFNICLSFFIFYS